MGELRVRLRLTTSQAIYLLAHCSYGSSTWWQETDHLARLSLTDIHSFQL